MRKAVISTMVFVGVAPLVLLGTVPRADSATSCYESSCNGLYAPDTTCVNDAYVVDQQDIYDQLAIVGNVQLKYSPSCRATWTRVISDLSYGTKGADYTTGGGFYTVCLGDDTAGTGCNTDMVDDANVTTYGVGTVYGPGGTYFVQYTNSF